MPNPVFQIPSSQRFLPYLFLALAVFAVYSNIYDNALLFDDDLLIHLNTYLRDWSTFGDLLTASTTGGAHIAGGFYRPIQNLCYFIIFQISGEDVLGFHLLNVSLHALNACLGYRLALRLGIDPRAALFAMLLWAVHPLHTEAITYMSGTADPLFVCFCLLGLGVIFPQPTLRKVWLTVPLFVLALLSKETAVVLPALVIACLYFTSAERLKVKTYLITWPLWIIAGAFLAWRVNTDSFDGPARYAHLFLMPEYATLRTYTGDAFIRGSTFLATLPAYAGLLLWPVDLHMERAFPIHHDLTSPPVLGGIAMLIAAFAQIVWGKGKRGLALSWGLLWFGAAHAPNAGLLFPMNALFLEHWMYLPTMGLFLGIAQTAMAGLNRIRKPEPVYITLALIVAASVALSARTIDQNTIWHDPIVFYNNIFAHGAVSPRARNNLAIAYMDRHETGKAIEEYRHSIKEGDTYAETHYNLALALLSQPDEVDQYPSAIAELKRSLEIEPRFYRSYVVLGQIYRQMGDIAKADDYDRQAKEILGD